MASSTFTLYLPVRENPRSEAAADIPLALSTQQELLLPLLDSSTATDGTSHEAFEGIFEGKKILIVDDDMRNVYASVAAMEAKGMVALFAPRMAGYEAMRRIRRFRPFLLCRLSR